MNEIINQKIKDNGIKENILSLQAELLGNFFEYAMFLTYGESWKNEVIKVIKEKSDKHINNYGSIIETICPRIGKNYKLIRKEEIKKDFGIKDMDTTALSALIVHDFLMQCCAYKQINEKQLEKAINVIRENRNAINHSTDNDDYSKVCEEALDGMKGLIVLLEKYNWVYNVSNEFAIYLANSGRIVSKESFLQIINKKIIDYTYDLNNLKQDKTKKYKHIRIEFVDNNNEYIKDVKFHFELISDPSIRSTGCEDGKGYSITLEIEKYNIVCDSVPEEYEKFSTVKLDVKASSDSIYQKIMLTKISEKYRQSNVNIETREKFVLKSEVNKNISTDFDKVEPQFFEDVSFNENSLAQNITSTQQLERGKKYYDAGKYEEALKSFMIWAEFGNTEAENCLGIMYYEKQNYEKAIEWYTKAAEQGNINAIINLADMYYYKDDVNENDAKKAFLYYQKAAGAGDGYAQNQLANCYDEGFGVNVDTNKVIKYYEQAAAQGYKEAMANLGRYYYKNGNYLKAKEWAVKALKRYEIQKNSQSDIEKCNRLEQLIKEAEKLILQRQDSNLLNYYKK